MERLSDLGKKCLYCKKELDSSLWSSHWDALHHEEHHYKLIKCGCGKKNWVKMDFCGSGHDESLKRPFSPLESCVRKVREK